MAKKRGKIVSKTLLLVGEGYAEKAFLAHLKSLFSNGSFSVTIVTAGGKGPEHVINHALACKKCDGYDYVIVLLDTDLAWPRKTVATALASGLCLVGSEPCLEGFLLDLAGRAKAETNHGCKALLHPLLSGPCTDRDSYSVVFTADMLCQSDNPKLRLIVETLQGKKSVSIRI